MLRGIRWALAAVGVGLLLTGGASIFARPSHRPDTGAFPGWDEILVGVEPAVGSALAGHPAWATLLRIWYALARPF